MLILQCSTWRQGEQLPGIEGLLCLLDTMLEEWQRQLRLAGWWLESMSISLRQSGGPVHAQMVHVTCLQAAGLMTLRLSQITCRNLTIVTV